MDYNVVFKFSYLFHKLGNLNYLYRKIITQTSKQTLKYQ